MAATFAFDRDHGTQTGSPTRGTTTSAGVTDVNWKNSDTEATAYSAAPITAGNNSYDNWLFGHFSGTYNQISAGLWAHTATAFGTGLTLKSTPACTGDGDRLLYTTPSASANANLTVDATSAIAIGSGVAVFFGATGPYATGKASSTTSNPAYTNYLTTQLQTSGSAAAGDTATVTMTLQYNEN
ncbi:MAG TPA: hypothetical protein VD999_05750 [Vitreimonas sp.]|nr:hypothetical protein [Vitreimonas sp.]